MRFWDSSALVTLFVAQPASARVRELLAEDDQVLVWVLSDVEVRSTLARLGREGALAEAEVQAVARRVDAFWNSVHVVGLVDAVRARAKRLLGVHDLRAADALQLGAVLAATFEEPLGMEIVSLDERLNAAARREGFVVLP